MLAMHDPKRFHLAILYPTPKIALEVSLSNLNDSQTDTAAAAAGEKERAAAAARVS
jgi:hypothetical protein